MPHGFTNIPDRLQWVPPDKRAKRVKGRLRKLWWWTVADSFDWICVECGSTDILCMDHITPLSAGGTNEQSNLQLLCPPCNRKKATIERRMMGGYYGK